MIFSSRSRSILAAYCWGGDLAKIARRSNAACSPPTATRSPTRCPPKPCSPCPNSTACCRCPTRPCTLPPEARGDAQFPTIGLFERNANNFTGTRNTKSQSGWSSRQEEVAAFLVDQPRQADGDSRAVPLRALRLALLRRPAVHHQLPDLRRPRRRDHPLHLPSRPRVVLVSPAHRGLNAQVL